MTGDLSIQIPIVPSLDARRFNVLLKQLKDSLGALGQDIKPIDAKALNDELKKVDKEMAGIEQSFKSAFNAGSVEDMKGQLQDLLKELDGIDEKSKDGSFAEKYFKFEALQGGADKVSELAEKTNETREAFRLLGAQTGATGAELEALKRSAGDVFEQGGFANMGEAVKAIGTAKQLLGDFLDPQGMEEFVHGAAGIAKTFDKDVNEVIGKSRTFIASFGLEGKEAADLISFAMQGGGTAMDDVLDSMDEYSQLARDAGFSAEEFVGTLVTGVKAGTRDVDKLADSIKESGLRLRSGDASSALQGIQNNVSKTLQGIVQAAQQGDISISQAMQKSAAEIERAFNAGEINDSMRQQLQVAVSGTQAEDIGTELWGKIFSAPIDPAAITAQAAIAGEQIAGAIEPKGIFAGIQAKAERAFGDIAGFIGPALGPMAQFAQLTTAVGPAMEALKTSERAKEWAKMGGEILKNVKNLFLNTAATEGQAIATGVQTAATGGATVATGLLGAAMSALPIFAIIAGIALVAAAFGAFSTSTEEIVEDLDNMTSASEKARENLSKSFTDTAASDKQANALKGLAQEYRSLENDTSAEGQKRFGEVSQELAQKVPEAKKAVEGLNEAGKENEKQFKISADIVDSFADSQLKSNKAIREGAISDAVLHLRELSEAAEDAKERNADLTKDIEALQTAIENGDGSVKIGGLFDGERVFGLDSMQKKLEELTSENGKLEESIQSAGTESQQLVATLTKGGVSVERIAKGSGESTDEIKKMGEQAKLAEDAMKKTAQATSGLGSAASQSAQKVQELAAAYEKIKSAADSAYSGAFNGVLGIREENGKLKREIELAQVDVRNYQAELQKLAGKFDPISVQRQLDLSGDIAAAQLKIKTAQEKQTVLARLEKDEIKNAKEALAEKRRLERESKILQLQVGEIDLSVTDFKDQADQIRQQIDNILFGIVNDSLDDEVAKKIGSIRQGLKGELEGIDKQIKDVKDKVIAAANDNDPTTTTANSQLLINQLNRLKAAKEAEAEAAIARIQIEAQENRLENLRKYLDDQDALINAAIDRRIAQLDREAERITIVDDATYQRFTQNRLEALSLQQTKEIGQILKGNDLYIQAQTEVQAARRDLEKAKTAEEKAEAEKRFNNAQQLAEKTRNALIAGDQDAIRALIAADPELARLQQLVIDIQGKIASAGTQAEKDALTNQQKEIQKRIEGQEEYLDSLFDLSVESHQNITALDQKYNDLNLKVSEEGASALYAKRAEQLEREFAQEQRAAERKADIAKRQYEAVIGGISTALSVNVDKEVAEAEKRLEQIKEEQLLSDESFEQRKTEIEEEAQKKRTLIAAQEEGARSSLEIASAEASLERDRQLLERKIELAEKLGQKDIADGLRLELDDVKLDLAQKGNEIAALAEEMSPKLGDAFSGLFAGNAEQAKEGFRSYFGALAGGLKQLAAAKISEVLLNMIGPGGLVGLIAGFAVRPLVTSLVNAVMNPIVSGLLSFSTGGRVDSPTLFMAGDGSRLGGGDREWIFRDDQLRLLMATTINGQTAALVGEIQELRAVVTAWPTELVAKGEELRLASGRNKEKRERRQLGIFANRKAA